MKVLFVARSLDNMAGGVERMITTVMNALYNRGFDVELLTWDQAGVQSFYTIDPGIKWHCLDMGDHMQKAGIGLIVRRAFAVRKILKSGGHQVVICFQDGPYLSLRVFSLGMGIPIIAAERNAPTRFDHTRKGRTRRFITFNAFRFARKILLQCEEYRSLYPNFLRKRIEIIPNPVFPANEHAYPGVAGENGRYKLLSVGRLGYQKNYGCLIKAFAILAPKFPDWDLEIIGEGEERGSLECMVKGLGLGQRVRLPGAKQNVEKYYKQANLFCLPSRWEGFPNALGEAFAHGLPGVGFADCAGINSLIKPGENGLLAQGNGDSVALARTLEKLMKDHGALNAMGASASSSARAYAPDTIFARWEQVVRDAVNI